MSWRYHEGEVRDACADIRACYREAGREPDDLYPVWIARTVYDAALGLAWATSVQKHRRECRAALGLDDDPGPYPTRTGRVRLDGRAMVDDSGPWLVLGASYFPLLWLVRHDRDRLLANLTWLKAQGVDFVRAFGDVGGPTWSDRVIDMDAATYATDLHDALGLVRDLGLRVAWTLFAGPQGAHAPDWYPRKSLTFADALAGRLDAVQYVEVRNEAEGPDDATMRACAAALTGALPGLPVALCGTPESGLPALYSGSAATVATVHYDRAYSERGWRPVRQPWGYYELDGMPEAHVDNEPIGIDSSVAAEADPVKLAAAAVTAWLTGECAYVLHHGAGIRAGGAADLARGRQADVWDQPAREPALALIAGARALLPADLPTWSRHGHAWPSHPLAIDQPVGDAVEAGAAGCNRAYAATRGDRAVCLIAGIRGHVSAADKAGRMWTPYVPRPDGTWTAYGPTDSINLSEAEASAALLIRERGSS
jgi:hypothetical protein